MNPIYYFIPVAVIAVGIFFSIVMTKKYKAASQEINIDQERLKYQQYKNELLKNDFSYVKDWMKGKPIDAFTSISFPKSDTNEVKQMVKDGMKNMALSAVGIRLQRVETYCFAVLSNKDLHIFTTDVEGELNQHLVFDNARLDAAVLQYTGVRKSALSINTKASEAYLPKVHLITFNIDEAPLQIELHDRLRFEATASDMFSVKKMQANIIKYMVVGEQFVKALETKYPNLEIQNMTNNT
jgi:hypothetical protein